jgi:hypothetical protein
MHYGCPVGKEEAGVIGELAKNLRIDPMGVGQDLLEQMVFRKPVREFWSNTNGWSAMAAIESQ